jgi:predicted flap endonuclease-1-like 5' DNA nuclease
MAGPGRDDGLDLSEIRHVERIGVGSLNPNQPVSEEQRDAQIRFLNRCLNDMPRGKIIGREMSTAVFQVGEHQITMQLITYHVGFKRTPRWIEEEKARQAQAAVPQPPPPPPADNFKVVEGIGPNIEQMLHAAGIRTYTQLATVSLETIQQVLTEAGSDFNLVDPTTWSHQAALAATGQWDELALLQEELQGGRRMAEDDSKE